MRSSVAQWGFILFKKYKTLNLLLSGVILYIAKKYEFFYI
jgi:hypothetical protein